jgi:3-oxoacyl-[acyl-carrier-protein] synthase-1
MAANTTKVQIAGVGAFTAVGYDAPSTAAAVRAAISGFADHAFITDKDGAPIVVANISCLPESTNRVDDFEIMAMPAAAEALLPLTRGSKSTGGLPLILGLPPARPGRPVDLDTELKQRFKVGLGDGNLLTAVRTIPTGHASGLAALEQAWRLIRSREIEACLIGGIDSYDHLDTYEWLEELEQLHSKANTWGFVPGQAAGFVLLASAEFAQKNKLPDMGEVVHVALTREENLIKTDAVCIGAGLSSAVRQVCVAASPEQRPIHQTICDLNGERYRASEFGYALTRTGDFFANAGEYTAPADCWGDVGAASAPLFIGLAVAAGQKKYATGPNTLIWASSESGERAAAVLRIESNESGV